MFKFIPLPHRCDLHRPLLGNKLGYVGIDDFITVYCKNATFASSINGFFDSDAVEVVDARGGGDQTRRGD